MIREIGDILNRFDFSSEKKRSFSFKRSNPLASNGIPEFTSNVLEHPLMKFSVVIPTYRRHETLFQCLDALSHYFESTVAVDLGFDVEVVVSDDGAEVELRKKLLELYPWCRYIEGPSRGPAANRNHGASQTSGTWIVFTDDDCLPQRGWLEAYYSQIADNDVLEGRTSPCGVRTRIDEECPINESGGVLWSCNFAIRKSVFQELGGFNESFPGAAMEDVEFNTRIKNVDVPRSYVNDALVYHPWRKRKGFAFARQYAKSVAHYVNLHPEKAKDFRLPNQIVTAVRCTKRNLIFSFKQQLTTGFVRQTALDLYCHLQVWRELKCRN